MPSSTMLALGAAIGLCAVSCSTAQKAASPTAEAHIDEARARELVLNKYHALFRNSYTLDQRTGAYHRYPQLEAATLTNAEFRGDAWLVSADPPAGWIVRARVGPTGDWVELTEVAYNDW